MPLHLDEIFKAELLEQLEGETIHKRAHMSKDDAYSLATARYYEPLLDQVNQALKALRTAVPARIKPALSKARRRELLGCLGARLEYYAWQYHCALAAPNFNILPNPTQAQIDDLCGTALPPGPGFLARHAVTTVTNQFITYLTAVVNNVQADWNDIRNVFFPLWDLRELVKLGASGSDSHKGGKSVIILSFNGKSLPPVPVPVAPGDYARNFFHISTARKLKLIYKPADLTLDFLMVGNTANVIAHVGGLPNPPGGSLFENLNAAFLAGPLAVNPTFAACPPMWMPIYSVLPRNSGILATAYGYIEFLEHGPNAKSTGPYSFNVQLRPRDRLHWDWITENNADLVDFYRLFGWYCALGMNFGMADAHNQNVIVHNKKAHLIDLEVSFKYICETIGKTGLHDVMASPGPAKKGDWCHLFYRNGGVLNRTTGAQAAHYINQGMAEAFPLIQADPGGVLLAWLTWIGGAGCIARYTPRKTDDYGQFLRIVYMAARSPVPPPFGPSFPLIGDIRIWYQQDKTDQPNFALIDPQHDWQCYLNCDYPAYYRNLNNMDLVNARGVVVNVVQPVIAWNAPNVHNGHPKTVGTANRYFDHSPSIFKFEIPDVTLLPPPGNSFVHLNANVVADLIASFAAAVPPIALTGAAVGTEEKEDHQWRIIDGLRIFHILRRGDGNAVRVYETGTAAAMILRQFDRFRNEPPFRAQLLADAQAFVTATYPPPPPPLGPGGSPPPPIYNGF